MRAKVLRGSVCAVAAINPIAVNAISAFVEFPPWVGIANITASLINRCIIPIGAIVGGDRR
jgi:hypothetical protein